MNIRENKKKKMKIRKKNLFPESLLILFTRVVTKACNFYLKKSIFFLH